MKRVFVRPESVLFVAIFVTTGLFATSANGGEQPLVFVSIPPQKYLVEELAGDLVRVEVLLPPGASPATYEPTPRQLANLDRAAVYFQIGSPFEGPLLKKLTNRHGRIVSRRKNGCTAASQNAVAKAIKRARFMGLMPYVGE